MIRRLVVCLVLTIGATNPASSQSAPDTERDILVTYKNEGARSINGGFGAPYSNRKRYTISAQARRYASSVQREFNLQQVDHWPIKSLSVYCFVYRIGPDQDRNSIIERLKDDQRVESVQELKRFETSTKSIVKYNDTYANLQHSIGVLNIQSAHRHSLGENVEIAIIDSHVDSQHEDLAGRIDKVGNFINAEQEPSHYHATAIASVIGATTNNGAGIAGIAPNAKLSVLSSCWDGENTVDAVCDTFSLAKALDSIIENPPNVLNLSLAGPDDALLTRLLEAVIKQGVIVVAAQTFRPVFRNGNFSSISGVIVVGNASTAAQIRAELVAGPGTPQKLVFAPGDRIMVAIPGNKYDLKSGVSLATAHVTGVVALLLARLPNISAEELQSALSASQSISQSGNASINACAALEFAHAQFECLLVEKSEI